MIDPEANVLGSILIHPDAYWRVADIVTAEDFANGTHRRLWTLLADMSREGATIDMFTAAERDPSLERVIGDLAQTQAYAGNVRAYAEVMVKRATERRVAAAGQRIAALRGEDSLSEAHAILATCNPRNTSAVKPIRDFLRETVAGLQERLDATTELTGVATSIPALDAMTSGWQRADLIVLAARPSVGKTALALQAALHAALDGTPVLFFSAEMAGRQLTDRAVAHVAKASLAHIRAPKELTAEEWTAVNAAGVTINGLPLYIDDSSGITVEAISARARQVDAEKRLGLVVIDYLTHLRLPKAETVAEAIQIATRQLKDMAKAIRCPVLLLSQLNRDGDQKPTLATLRGSGAIEQDADLILLLHRPDASKREQITLEVAKQRNGETGEIWLHADMARMKFTETEAPVRAEAKRPTFGPRATGDARNRAAGG